MLDVLRAGTSICSALYNGAKEVIATESLDKAVELYHNLSREARFLGGERHGLKPSGFDAGNSPAEYGEAAVKNKTVIMTTSNGTRIFRKASGARLRVIGGFVNMQAVTGLIKEKYLDNRGEPEQLKISILCAGTDGRFCYEDALCAGAIIEELSKYADNIEMTDPARAVNELYRLHSENPGEFIRTASHARFLQEAGFGEDIDTALTLNKFPVVPIIDGSSIRKYKN